MNTQVNKIITNKIYMNHPHLFAKWAYNDKTTPRYSVVLVIPKEEKETLKEIDIAIDDAINQALTLLGNETLERKDFSIPIRDGDDGLISEVMYKGSYFFTASSPIKPGVVDEKLKDLITDAQVPAGSCCRASICFQPYNINGRVGISCRLINLQVFKERFDPTKFMSSPEEDFG